eukprot:scaffold76652_cov31-Tisochrysis_lutea.AAC.2
MLFDARADWWAFHSSWGSTEADGFAHKRRTALGEEGPTSYNIVSVSPPVVCALFVRARTSALVLQALVTRALSV